MSWTEHPPSGIGRGKVALVAGAIVVTFILIFVLIVHFAGSGSNKPKSALATPGSGVANVTSSSTSSSIQNPSTIVNGATPPSTADFDYASPQGSSYTPDQLANKYPKGQSNLGSSEFDRTAKIATDFVTADTTGAGADQFGYYYNSSVTNVPWLKSLNIQWVYGNSDNAGTVHVQVWLTGVGTNGKIFNQVEQDVYLDQGNNDHVIPVDSLGNFGIPYDPTTCCTYVNDAG